jgi:hypothetical protein
MNKPGARPHDELDLEALARGDRVAAEVLVEHCRGAPSFVFDPDVFAALAALSKARSLARDWQALMAQLKGVEVDVPRLKQALKAADEGYDDDGNAGDSQAERLLAIAEAHEYFCNEFGAPYMSVELPLADGGSRLETLKIWSKKARLFFVTQYMRLFGKPPTDTALRGVLEALAARATFSDEVHPVFIRCARHNGAIYLDRGTSDGSAYEIDKSGWRVVMRPPVRFVRVPGMRPLPEAVLVDPKEGLRKLKEVTRFQTERDGVLVVAFMLGVLGGDGPYPVLVITGEAGSAKSTLAKLIGFLVDPRSRFLLSAPHSALDVYISASNRFLVAFNNLSHLEPAISDAICTATEGGASSRRALFTNDEESSIHARAPFILVAINNIVTRGDLADRELKTELAAMPPSERLTESEYWAKVEEAAPAILGALMGALSEGLRRYDDLEQENLPRLASFAKFVSACEPAFWSTGTFARAFAEAASTAAADVLADDPITAVFEEFMADKREWKGTSTVLLRELETIVRRPEREAEIAHALAKNEASNTSKNTGGKAYESLRTDEEKAKEREVTQKVAEALADLKEARERVHDILGVRWPKAPNALSGRLRKLGPQLRDAGILIVWPTCHGDEKVLKISNVSCDPLDGDKTRERSSSTSRRPQPTDEGDNNPSDIKPEPGLNEAPRKPFEGSSSGSSADDPREADSTTLSSIARAVVDFARLNDLKLMLVDGRLAFDEHLWRKTSPQMLRALYSCESEITAWLGRGTAQPNGWTYE